MQLLGSIIGAIAVIAVTIAVVTSQLGPFKEDTERQEQIQDQQEEQREQQEERRDEAEDRRDG
jgi:type II secretory pathway pseudopilin PulG